MALLSWKLCDLQGRTLGKPFQSWNSDSVIIPLNGQRTALLNVSTDENAALRVAPLSRVLKCVYGATPIFAGQVGTPKWDGASQTVEIPATDPSLRVQAAPLEPPAPPTGPYVLQIPNTDQSQIMWQLIQAARPTSAEMASGVPDLGIAQGSLPPTRWRDRFYEPGQNPWDAIVLLSQVAGGMDFELQPLDRTDGVLAQFNTYARQGSDKSASVVFHFNWGRDNCQNVVYSPDASKVINRSIYQGQAEFGNLPPFYRSNQLDAQKAFGLFKQFTARSDISNLVTLQEHAQAEASILAYPPDFFEVIPAVEGVGAIDPASGTRQVTNPATGRRYGVPPLCAPDGDYWLGDTITVLAQLDSQGLVKVKLRGRVTQIELSSEGATGDARVKLTCAPELPSYPVT